MSSSLSLAQQYLTHYGITTYLILGNIGLLFNMIIFGQWTHRRNSCSLYILTMSFCSFIGLNDAVIPIIYALYHPNLLSYSLIFCKIRYYLRHAFSQSMRFFFVLAFIDRYATCINQVRTRSFSRYEIAIRIIPSVILFWLMLALFLTMLYSVTDGVCDVMNGIQNIIYSIYILIVLGIFPTLSMITFVLLLVNNLKGIHTRVHPMQSSIKSINILRKRDRDNFARLFLLYLNNSLSFWIFFINITIISNGI